MDRPVSLPSELENQIIDQLIGDNPTLADLALVSRRWLEETRRRFFFTCPVVLAVPPRPMEHSQVQALLRDQNCTFLPYIREVQLHGRYPGDEGSEGEHDKNPEYNATLYFALSILLRLPRLHTLQFRDLSLTDTFDDLIIRVVSTTVLSRLELHAVLIESPYKLLTFLGAFPEPKPRIDINNINFESSEWDAALAPTVCLDSSPAFDIVLPDHGIDSSLFYNMILKYGLNVTRLHIAGNAESIQDLRLLGEVIRHTGPSLTELAFGINRDFTASDHTSNLISLENNTSLTSVVVSTLDFNFSPKIIKPISSLWITSLIGSIRSKAKFNLFQLYLFRDFQVTGNWEETMVEFFAWRPVDDMMMDEERFPGDPVNFSLVFGDELEPEETRRILEERCLPSSLQFDVSQSQEDDQLAKRLES